MLAQWSRISVVKGSTLGLSFLLKSVNFLPKPRSDIPKSDSFDVRNWRNWQQQHGSDDGDHGGADFVPQPNKQFKRNIPNNGPPKNFGSFQGQAGFGRPEFYPSAPAPNAGFPKQNVFDPQSFQPDANGGGGDDDDDEGQQFDYQVNFNENDNKNFRANFQPPTFKRSPQEGSGPGLGGQANNFQQNSGFTPSFGGSGFPSSVGYNTEAQSDDTAGFYNIDDDDAPARGQPEFDFPARGSFGEAAKDGRGGVSQSYSTFTGPDGKSSGFFVPDHNNGGAPGGQVPEKL